jgi:NADH-quinone oxidoreductase subunit H
MGYELPFLLSLLVAVVHTGGSLRISSILSGQAMDGAVAANVSGFIAFIISVICIVAKIGLVPFDQAEAETEIMGGVLVSYSGPPLALMLVTRAMLHAVMPILLISVFWGGIDVSPAGVATAGFKYVFLVVVMIVIRNTNPRLRIDQALVFFWGVISPLALAALVLAITGSVNGISWL